VSDGTEITIKNGKNAAKKALEVIRHWLNNATLQETPAPSAAGRNNTTRGSPPRVVLFYTTAKIKK
jgi:hypothetical protein